MLVVTMSNLDKKRRLLTAAVINKHAVFGVVCKDEGSAQAAKEALMEIIKEAGGEDLIVALRNHPPYLEFKSGSCITFHYPFKSSSGKEMGASTCGQRLDGYIVMDEDLPQEFLDGIKCIQMDWVETCECEGFFYEQGGRRDLDGPHA